MITQERLKEVLHYDAETGLFVRRFNSGTRWRSGQIAGSIGNHGYIEMRIDGRLYLAHRLAWLYVYGQFPPECLDHRNRIRTDNRLFNLRLATIAENQENLSVPRNNKSGHVGVSLDKSRNQWAARIQVRYRTIHLGRFNDIDDAIAARAEAKSRLHTFSKLAID